ncbi:MAG TPA: hypothetical protein VEI97_02070, partial [bacterium]|nr:hypothetical protein [bacterium]
MPRNHLAPLVLAALLAFAAPATAQGGDTTVPADDYAVEEAEGPVSEADIVALCEFTAWMYERLVQSQDPSLGLPADAPDRAVDFWAGTIGALDAETILLIGEMEQIFPAAQANWRAADADGQAAIVENVRNLVVLVWGDQVVPMASYLAGEITYDQFAPSIDVVL